MASATAPLRLCALPRALAHPRRPSALTTTPSIPSRTTIPGATKFYSEDRKPPSKPLDADKEVFPQTMEDYLPRGAAFNEEEEANVEARKETGAIDYRLQEDATLEPLRDWLRQVRNDPVEYRKYLQMSGRPNSRKPMPVKINNKNFWEQDEPEEDLINGEIRDEDPFDEDDILSMAHGKLEEHREYRHYARVAAWEMPLLANMAHKFQPPTSAQALRFRHTTYMGEKHPAERKVVVEFCPQDLPLTPAQQLKLKKLAGVRYNPEKDLVKMSCEAYDHAAQNKRRLGDLVNKLIEEAKDETDPFTDIPLDFRHHPIKQKNKMPTSWRITPERTGLLADQRKASKLLDQYRLDRGHLVDGNKLVNKKIANDGVYKALSLAAGPLKHEDVLKDLEARAKKEEESRARTGAAVAEAVAVPVSADRGGLRGLRTEAR